MKSFRARIMASDHMVYDGEAYSVVVPTTEGRTGILADHSNLIMALVPGILEFAPADGTDRQEVVVSEGLLKMENGELMILTDTAERPEDIDEARAASDAKRAEEELRRSRNAREHAVANAELARSFIRIKASKKKHRL